MVDASEQTIAFVDLAGFTALTETHGDNAAADLAEALVALATAALGPTDQLIKSIGDAVMLSATEPLAGIALVQRLLAACYTTADFPLPRAGIHHGPVVARGHDLFGGTVNLAARVASQASGAQVLATTAVAQPARTEGITVINLGSFVLRNVTDPVELFELALYPPPEGGAIDPVCRMHVERNSAAGRFRHAGTNYWFCSLRCAATFIEQPARYTTSRDHDKHG